ATGGSEDGLDIFDRWSQRSAKYNALTTRARWEHYFRSPPERIGIGSLIHLATKSAPDWRDRLDYALWERVARQNYGGSFYELCGIATPEEPAAGAPLIKKRGPGLRGRGGKKRGAQKKTHRGNAPRRTRNKRNQKQKNRPRSRRNQSYRHRRHHHRTRSSLSPAPNLSRTLYRRII